MRRGTHVLIALPEGMTPQEAQQRFSNDIGFVADPALKDVASRCIYMVPSESTLYVSEELFNPSTVCHSDDHEGGRISQDTPDEDSAGGDDSQSPSARSFASAQDDTKEECTAMLVSTPSGGVEGAPFPLEFDG